MHDFPLLREWEPNPLQLCAPDKSTAGRICQPRNRSIIPRADWVGQSKGAPCISALARISEHMSAYRARNGNRSQGGMI
jgi:hypothetical protein